MRGVEELRMGRECVVVIDRWLCSVIGDWGVYGG